MDIEGKDDRFRRYFEAARELESRGERPTLRAVRRMADGGSMTDVAAAMQAYRERAIAPTQLEDGPTVAMLSAVRALHRQAQEETLALVAGERAALTSAQQDVAAFRDELQELATEIERERDQALAQVQEFREEAERLKAALAFERGRLAVFERLPMKPRSRVRAR